MGRRRTWQAAAQLLAVVPVACAAVAGLGYEVETYSTWGTFAPAAGPPPRIDWCGRRYYPARELWTRQQVDAEVAANVHTGNLRQIAMAPSGLPVLSATLSAQQQASFHTQVCTMTLYVELNADRYQPYGLSGGP